MTSRTRGDSPLVPPPIFIGGTGRSGTTILGDLLDTHPLYAVVPIELRFHSDFGGLVDVLANRVTMKVFVRNMLGPFYRRRSPGGMKGLHLIADKATVTKAVGTFVEQFRVNRFTAARDLVQAIIQPTLKRTGKQGWVEMTPWNVGIAATLYRIFPEMKLVHCVRDGRDVAASVSGMWWGPGNNPVDGLHWWCERIRGAEAAARMLPAEAVYIVHFEELMLIDRDRTLRDLCGYLGIDDVEVKTFFDTVMTADRAHVGRWADDLEPAVISELEHLYLGMFDELVADGVACRPLAPVAT